MAGHKTHAILDNDVARSILALSRNHGGAYLHEDRSRGMPPVVLEFDTSRAQRFNYLVNQLKHPSSSVENLITLNSFMAEFGDSFRADTGQHHHHPALQATSTQSLFNGHSSGGGGPNTANPAANNSTGDSDISYASSDLSEPGLGIFQNMFDNNFATADDHGAHNAAMQNYTTNHPLYGNRIHKPQPRKAAGNGPSSTTNPNMPHPNGRTSQYFNSPTYMQQQKAAGVVAAMAAAQSASNSISSNSNKQPRSNPVAHKSNGNNNNNITNPGPALTKARAEREPQFMSEEEKAKRDLTRERNNKYREKKMVENPFDYRRKKAEAQKRYMEKLKNQNPDIYRRRKVEYQKRYMDKKTKNATPYFYSL